VKRIIKRILEYEELAILFFPLVVLYVAPLFHEIGHIIVLKSFSCQIKSKIFFSFTSGIVGHIEPLCELTQLEAILVMWAGAFTTLILSLVFFSLAGMWRKRLFLPIMMDSIALGFFVSSFIDTLVGKGDIFLIFKILGIEIPPVFLSLIAFVLIAISLMYFWHAISEREKIFESREMLKT